MKAPNADSDDDNGEPPVLPLYGVEGWPSVSGHLVARMTSLNEDGRQQASSVSGRQIDGERLIEVTSYRHGENPIEELRNRTITKAVALGSVAPPQALPADNDPPARSASTAEVAWTSVAIRVDDVPTDFAVASVDGGWAAVGEGPLSTIAVAARNVTTGEIRLVRLPDPPSRHLRSSRRRPQRQRSFPHEALTAPADGFGAASVDLTYANDRLTGTYDGLAIDLELHVPDSRSRTSGQFAGSDMAATWQLGNNYYEHPDVHSTLHGRFADQTVTATGTFHLDDDYGIESAVITGHLGTQTIEATVTALDGGLGSTSTVAIDGHCAETSVALSVTISGDLRHAIIVGDVDNTPVRLDARRQSGRSRRIELTGRYQGPPVLLAFIAPTLLHFI